MEKRYSVTVNMVDSTFNVSFESNREPRIRIQEEGTLVLFADKRKFCASAEQWISCEVMDSRADDNDDDNGRGRGRN
jgi:hypothetical protein